MKRSNKILLAAFAVAAVSALMIWSPLTRVSLERATVVLPASSFATPPPAGKDDVMAIIYSGDGGWADLDRRLGIALIDRGIPVLGVNTFKYYWRNRTADESAAELDALISKYSERWGKPRVWLIGYSFGADVLPTLIGKLSPANRARITQLVLLAPGRDLNFEIELEGYMIKQGWFKEHLKTLLQHVNPVPHYPALPPLLALDGHPAVICDYGMEDADDTVCTEPNLPAWVTVHGKRGDHHFDGGYQPLAVEMLKELPARLRAGAVTP